MSEYDQVLQEEGTTICSNNAEFFCGRCFLITTECNNQSIKPV
ncbi:hypothetical protein B4U80_07499 [Leptotrombidium deliense]|uniref:Uncharacterized protein n=1 Tax=Leptotrombidium deliense TaxID=299467 RepID=A0A443SEK1_9ACAR|nr:hypothetical protein B4U80_07499 [Leptotrombidium deliense]